MAPASTLAFTHETLAQRVIFGAGKRHELAEQLDAFNYSRGLVIGGGSASSVVGDISNGLDHRVAALFSDPRQHVPVELVQVATQAATDAGADCLISVGGGSAIGLAKAVALNLRLPVFAVPTTLSGSEMTPIFGITGSEGKVTGTDPIVLPRVVVYDPELYGGLPSDVLGPSVFNSLAHATGGLRSVVDPLTTAISSEAVRVLVRALRSLRMRTTPISSMENLVYGGFLGGYSLAHAGTWIHHTICHILGGTYSLPHAPTHAALLPHSVSLLKTSEPDAYAKLAQALEHERPEGLIFDLLSDVMGTFALSSYGMTDQMALDVASMVAPADGMFGLLGREMIAESLARAVNGSAPLGP